MRNNTIGNYTLVKQLGVGGIGTVYLAQHQFVHQMAAIKVHEVFPSDEHVRAAFLRASNYLSQLNHPNIVQLYNYGFEDGHAYQVMEYVAGPNLAEFIPDVQTKVWVDRCIEYFSQLVAALVYSHNCKYQDTDHTIKRGIIHGDIKPQNILLDMNKDIVKFVDFMIPDVQAALGEKDFQFDMTNTTAFGTPGYMAPEQIRGTVTQQTDIFSLGVTMYQLVTGYGPDTAGSEMVMMWMNIPPRQINPYLPEWLDQLIVKAIQMEPGDRFHTATEMMRVFISNKQREKPSLIFHVKEWFMGDQINNQIGDISNISGQLFIGKFNTVVSTLNAGGQTALAEALTTLKEAVMTSTQLTSDKKQENVDMINQIGEEAAKPKPNKTLLKILSDGLMATLKAVPDIASAVTAVSPLLTQLHL